MSRYQAIFSVFCMLVIATGVYAIVEKVVAGFSPGTWGLFCLFACLALVMGRIIDRLPMSHEAVFRVAGAPHWNDLSSLQRCGLMFFDWPLFSAIRDREIQCLLNEPLIKVTREANGISFEPLEKQHGTRFFLKVIASGIAIHGMRTQVDFSKSPETLADKGKVELVGGDERILQYVCDEVTGGELVSLRHIARTVEHGYISTLSDKERHAYMWAMR